ncbi:MAG: DUF3043 domain-containing protein [Sporichthyaceae bacterium]
MFTRREKSSAAAAEELTPVSVRKEATSQAPKGRPTPKRSQAEQERKDRIRPPRDTRAAAKATRARRAAERKSMREAMVNGDERYLPGRDQGPVRRYVRDFVDSRISAAEFFLPGALLILVLLVAGVGDLGSYIWSVMVVVIAFDSMFFTTKMRRDIRRRFPDERRRGAIAYALLRSMTWRSLRTPKPRLARGQKP